MAIPKIVSEAMSRWGRTGGKIKTEKKSEAARLNGLKGGRPPGSKNKLKINVAKKT
jgi:hypothetical protein